MRDEFDIDEQWEGINKEEDGLKDEDEDIEDLTVESPTYLGESDNFDEEYRNIKKPKT